MSAYRKFVDTLQREPRTPAPPKPPKAPKANPSEPVSHPVLGVLGTLGAPPIKNEISLHATTPPHLSFSSRAILDDFKNEGAANGEQDSDTPLSGTAIIAPGKWVERIASPASGEPGFSEPWPPRRGRIQSEENTLHFCCVCGTASASICARGKWGGGSAPLTVLTAGQRGEFTWRAGPSNRLYSAT
jgi:hypothetical protein